MRGHIKLTLPSPLQAMLCFMLKAKVERTLVSPGLKKKDGRWGENWLRVLNLCCVGERDSDNFWAKCFSMDLILKRCCFRVQELSTEACKCEK